MKVLFDHQIFSLQRYGGISRYHYELLKHLPEKGVEAEVSLCLSNNYYLRQKDVSSHHQFFPNFNLRIRNNYIKKSNRIYTENKLRMQEFDVFHPTYYDDYFLEKSLLGKKPFVLTIHDMTTEKFMPNDPILSLKRKMINRASKIIAISHRTKEDILEFMNVSPDKVEVVYHGNNLDLQKITPKMPKRFIFGKYILYVGGRSGYKNFNNLIKAFLLLIDKYPYLRLVCTGSHFSSEEKKMLAELNLQNKVISFLVTDEELAWLYQNAEVFVFPSLYEGFGFPILEAFSMGCPIVISDASCFPEIAGDSAVYFDPLEIESIHSAIEKVICSFSVREELVQKGYEKLKSYSWERTASETVSVYESII